MATDEARGSVLPGGDVAGYLAAISALLTTLQDLPEPSGPWPGTSPALAGRLAAAEVGLVVLRERSIDEVVLAQIDHALEQLDGALVRLRPC